MSAVDNESLERLFGARPRLALARNEPLFRQGEPASAISTSRAGGSAWFGILPPEIG